MVPHTAYNFSSKVGNAFFWLFQAPSMYMLHIYTCKKSTNMHKIKNLIFYFNFYTIYFYILVMFLPLPQLLPNSLLPPYPFNFMLSLLILLSFFFFYLFYNLFISHVLHPNWSFPLPLLLLIPRFPLSQLHSASISLQEREGLRGMSTEHSITTYN